MAFVCVLLFVCVFCLLLSLDSLLCFVCLLLLCLLNACKWLLKRFYYVVRVFYRVNVFSVLNRCLLCSFVYCVLVVLCCSCFAVACDIALYALNAFKRLLEAFI